MSAHSLWSGNQPDRMYSQVRNLIVFVTLETTQGAIQKIVHPISIQTLGSEKAHLLASHESIRVFLSYVSQLKSVHITEGI